MGQGTSVYQDEKKYRRILFFRRLSGKLVLLFPIVFFLLILYPFVWTVLAGFKTTNEIFDNIWGLPRAWHFENYLHAWQSGISRYFVNSLVVTVATCLLTLTVCSLYCFALNAFSFRGKRIFYLLGIAGLMFSPIVSLIPLYQEIQALHLYDTRIALILIYASYQIPMSVMLIHSSFSSIDQAYLDAARIDGCSNLGILRHIFIPLSKPIMMTSIILTAFYAWNEFSFALTFLKTKAKMTIPIGLISFQGEMHTEWAIMIAGLVISAVPIIVFFIFTQRYFIAGLNAGGVKG